MAGEASIPVPSHRFGLPAERGQLANLPGLPVQVASAGDDFSTHSGENRPPSNRASGPDLEHDTQIGLSESAVEVLRTLGLLVPKMRRRSPASTRMV